ncbi:MAG: threonylcarbamoyl-AMP synthase, partial [Armatimonadetes bacterium]|nr:threonylcarbamoyl-AMP synthase [Anaerolineae bacterium]
KRRPAHDPLIVHIHDVAQLALLAIDIPPIAHDLAQAFWAGPLTLVLKRGAHVPSSIASGLDTVAIRMPAHPVARALLQATGFPIAAPSANTFTRPSATTAAHVLEDLDGRIDLVLDGGPAPIGLESTVVDLTQTPPVVLRPGGLLLNDLRRILPDIQLNPKYMPMNGQSTSASPGMLMKHYSPRAHLTLFDGPLEVVLVAMTDSAQRLIANGKRVGILAIEEEASTFTETGARIISLGRRDDLAQIGRVLFGGMRALDAQGVDAILIRSFGQEGLGAAIWDRLLRAAEGRVTHVR